MHVGPELAGSIRISGCACRRLGSAADRPYCRDRQQLGAAGASGSMSEAAFRGRIGMIGDHDRCAELIESGLAFLAFREDGQAWRK